ncbi:hypothetical protein V3C99_011681 [Haemonchus contortus]|uniref:Uncharacterized protein n=1 Tax=Haemonchus contortus TaxID=6289 RepID=A0A7I4Y611_HAECO|nr:unnamed protein product [Haemonchus contortus]
MSDASLVSVSDVSRSSQKIGDLTKFGNITKAPRTRRLSRKTTTTSNLTEVLEDEGEITSKGKQMIEVTVAFAIVAVVIIFIFFMLYIRAVAKRKKRALEETRKRIGETVVTAGSGGGGTMYASGRSTPKEKQKKVAAMQDGELKSFRRSGPLVMQASLTGEVKHLQTSESKSLEGPITFHPSMNEIVLIGTEVDKIVGKITKTEENEVEKNKKQKKRKEKVHECSTQTSTRSVNPASTEKPQPSRKKSPNLLKECQTQGSSENPEVRKNIKKDASIQRTQYDDRSIQISLKTPKDPRKMFSGSDSNQSSIDLSHYHMEGHLDENG